MAALFFKFSDLLSLGTRVTRYLLLGVVASFLSASALAGVDSYVCTISSFSWLRDDGILVSDPKDPIIGEEFTVDRTTGKIIGRYMSSTGFRTEVLDAGSTRQAFKVLARNSAGFLHVLYLEIQEFHNAVRKPFILVQGTLVYGGACE